jgi:hypothetical protein
MSSNVDDGKYYLTTTEENRKIKMSEEKTRSAMTEKASPGAQRCSSSGKSRNTTCFELPDNKWLHAQLKGLERKTRSGGRDLVDHYPGGQDDLANSVAGVCVMAVKMRPLRKGRVIGYSRSGVDLNRMFRKRFGRE